MKNKYIISLIAGIFLLTSCEKWLDEPKPETMVTLETSTKTNFVADLDPLVNAAYNIAMGFSGAGYGGQVFLGPELCGDFLKPYETNYTQMIGSEELLMYQRRMPEIDYSVQARLMQYGNKATLNVNNVIKELRSGRYESDPNFYRMGRRLLGESFAIRAMIYFEMTKYMGRQYNSNTSSTDKAILLRTEPIENLSDLVKERATVQTCYDTIISDLKNAIQLLPEYYDAAVDPASYSVARFNRDCASALLSQVYFQQNNFDSCLVYLNTLLGNTQGASPKYPLETAANIGNNVFWRKGEETYGPKTSPVGKGEIIMAFSGMTGTKTTRNGNNAWMKLLSGLNLTGAGNIKPRSDISDAGWKQKWEMSNYFKTYVNFNTATDARYKNFIDVLNIGSADHWFCNKYAKKDINLMWFRSAEFLLMRAEIYARQGRSTEAIADLDVIRQRAGIGPYDSSTDKLPTLLESIIRERARELFTEKYRLWDLLRLGANTNLTQPEVDGKLIGLGDRLTTPASDPGADLRATGTSPIPYDATLWQFLMPSSETLYNPAAGL